MGEEELWRLCSYIVTVLYLMLVSALPCAIQLVSICVCSDISDYHVWGGVRFPLPCIFIVKYSEMVCGITHAQ